MISKKESSIVKDIIAALLKEFGGYALNVHGGRYQRKGQPDILYWTKVGDVRYPFAFETKRPGEPWKLTTLQGVKLDRMNAAGVYTFKPHSVEETLDFVRGVLHEDI